MPWLSVFLPQWTVLPVSFSLAIIVYTVLSVVFGKIYVLIIFLFGKNELTFREKRQLHSEVNGIVDTSVITEDVC